MDMMKNIIASDAKIMENSNVHQMVFVYLGKSFVIMFQIVKMVLMNTIIALLVKIEVCFIAIQIGIVFLSINTAMAILIVPMDQMNIIARNVK